MTTPPFALSFDYRCPFAGILHRHLISAIRSGADYDVDFVPWTLTQSHRKERDLDVWDDPARDDHLIALAAGVSIRDQQTDVFLNAHEALFVARHVNGIRLGTFDQIVEALSGLSVDLEMLEGDLLSRRPHRVIGENYRSFEKFEAFGVPTLVVGDAAVFIRYMDPPTEDATKSTELIDALVSMVTTRGSLNEFKHTRLTA